MSNKYNYFEMNLLDAIKFKANLRKTGSKYLIEYDLLNGLSLYETDDETIYGFGKGIKSNYDVLVLEENGNVNYVDEYGEYNLVTNFTTGLSGMQDMEIMDPTTGDTKIIKRGYVKSLGLEIIKDNGIYSLINGNTTYCFEMSNLNNSKYLLKSIVNTNGTSTTIERVNDSVVKIKTGLIKGHDSDIEIDINYGLNVDITYKKYNKVLMVVTLSYLLPTNGKYLSSISAVGEVGATSKLFDFSITRVNRTNLINKSIVFSDNKFGLTESINFDSEDNVISINDRYNKTLTINRYYSKTEVVNSNNKKLTFVFEDNNLNFISTDDNHIYTYLFDKDDKNKLLSTFVVNLDNPLSNIDLLSCSSRTIGGGYSLQNEEILSPVTNTLLNGVCLSIDQESYEYEETFNVEGKKDHVHSFLVYLKGLSSDNDEPGFIDVSIKYYDENDNLIDESQKTRINVVGKEDKYYMFSSYSKDDYVYFKIVCKVIAGEGYANLLLHAFSDGLKGTTILYDDINGRVKEIINNNTIDVYSYGKNGNIVSVNNCLITYSSETTEETIIETISSNDGMGNETRIIKEDGLITQKTYYYLGNVVNSEEYTYEEGTDNINTYKINDITYTFVRDERLNIVNIISSNGLKISKEYFGVNDLFPDEMKSISKLVGNVKKGECTVTNSQSTGINTTLTNMGANSVNIIRDEYLRTREVVVGNKCLAQIDFTNSSYPEVVTRYINDVYTYNENGDITAVNDYQSGTLVGTLSYNGKKLREIRSDGIIRGYGYDSNGYLKQILSVLDNSSLKVIRDKHNRYVGEERNVESVKGLVEYCEDVENVVEINKLQSYLGGLNKLIYSTFFVSRNDGKWDGLYCQSYNEFNNNVYDNQTIQVNDNGITCVDLKDSKMTYAFTGMGFAQFGFFIKLNEDVENSRIFDIFCNSNVEIQNYFFITNNRLTVTHGRYIEETIFEKGKWYYIEIKLIGDEYVVFVNGIVKITFKYGNDCLIGQVSMDYLTNSSILVTGIYFSDQIFFENEFKTISKLFPLETNIPSSERIDYSNLKNSAYLRKSIYIEEGNDLDLITLHKNELSVDGKNIVKGLPDDKNDVEKNYVYDSDKKSFVYNNFKKGLELKLDNLEKGSIMFEAKFNGVSSLFRLIDSNDNGIEFLFINGEIKLMYNNVAYCVSQVLEFGWHNFVLTWMTSDDGFNITLFIDGVKVIEKLIDYVFESSLKVSILHGIKLVENVRLSNSLLTSSQILAIINRDKYIIEKDHNTSKNIISKTIYNKGLRVNKTNFGYNAKNILVSQNDGLNQINYQYDSFGNVTRQILNGVCTEYTYDQLNRLVSCSHPNYARTYYFDNRGNIECVVKNGVNHIFTYDSYNRLTNYGSSVLTYPTSSASYSDGSFMYPASIRNGNDITSFMWERGKLKELIRTKNSVQMYRNVFTYDLYGLRIRKESYDENNVLTTCTYFYNECNELISEKRVKNGYVYVFKYYYDENGLLTSFSINNQMYFYLRDATGNIYAIINNVGTIEGTYQYDPYGNILVEQDISGRGVVSLNPFRYKGYYYDVETGLFWLSSRYYSPELCRFISPDDVSYLDPTSINGLNLYCYCGNDPVNKYDPSGHSAILVALLVGAIVGGAIYGGVSAGMSGGDVGDVFVGIGKGALNGLILGGGISLAIVGFAIGVTTILGSTMVNYGLSIFANMLEVAITQDKKSDYDGDNFWESANDINNAMFANSGKILIGESILMSIPFYGTRITSKIPTIFNVLISYEFDNLFSSTTFLASSKATLLHKAGPLGLTIGYILTAWQYYNLFKSIATTPDFENSRWILY